MLADLNPDDLRELLERGVRRTFGPREVLFHQGDPTDHVLVIVSGWVRVYGWTVTGQEVLHALRGPGDILGDEAALQGWPRPFSVQAVETVSVFQLLAGNFRAALYARPSLTMALVMNLQRRLRESDTARVDMATSDVEMRVMSYLLQLADQHGVRGPDGITVRVPLSQQDIANRVGASRRGVARVLAMLRERDVVTTGRRRLVIIRPDVLQQLARPV